MTFPQYLLRGSVSPWFKFNLNHSAARPHLAALLVVFMLLQGCTILRTCESLALPPDSVVLTFDDGPNPDRAITIRLLDVLAEKQVRAAFCLVGAQAEQNPEIVRRIAADGHLIVNHTYSHGPGWIFWRGKLFAEADRFDRAIAGALGQPGWRATHFRPPWGLVTPGVNSLLRERGMTLMPVSYYAGDALAGPAEADEIVSKTLTAARRDGGGVFVIHDGRQQSLPRPAGSHLNPNSGFTRDWVPAAAATLIDNLRAGNFMIADPAAIKPAIDRMPREN